MVKKLLLILILLIISQDGHANPILLMGGGMSRYSGDYEDDSEVTPQMLPVVSVRYFFYRGFFVEPEARYVRLENTTYPYGFGGGWLKKKRFMLYVPFKIGYAYYIEDAIPYLYIAPTVGFKLAAHNAIHIEPVEDDPVFGEGFDGELEMLMEKRDYGFDIGGGVMFWQNRHLLGEVEVCYHHGMRSFIGATDRESPRIHLRGYTVTIKLGYQL